MNRQVTKYMYNRFNIQLFLLLLFIALFQTNYNLKLIFIEVNFFCYFFIPLVHLFEHRWLKGLMIDSNILPLYYILLKIM